MTIPEAQALEHDARTLQEELDRWQRTPTRERARDELQRTEPAPCAHVEPAQPFFRAAAERTQEEAMDERRLCEDCGRYFAPERKPGRRPKRCPECREPPAERKLQSAHQEPASEPLPLASEARPAAPAAVEPERGPWAYTVRVRGLPVRCRTLSDLVAVVEHYGERG